VKEGEAAIHYIRSNLQQASTKKIVLIFVAMKQNQRPIAVALHSHQTKHWR
jgi:hypothetical protein